ncbi:MAG: hypothetical protein U0793_18020 [Gemmataceae bacterium]
MVHTTTVYIVEAKNRLVQWLKDSDPDLLECLRGPFAWTAKESSSSMDDLPHERLAKFKVLYFLWLLRSYDVLAHLPPGSRLSLDDFDEFWTVQRFEVEGDLADLRSGANRYDLGVVLPTGNPTIDAWIREMKEKTQKTQS